MRAKSELLVHLKPIITELGYAWPEKTVIEPPKDKKFGDISVNIAMLLAKESKKPPRELAELIAKKLLGASSFIEKAEVAGPGFLNIRYSTSFWSNTIKLVHAAGNSYGNCKNQDNKRVQIEYVSANPTGPLHIGHGRGAAIGDSLARVMRAAGYTVSTEYYINDAGKQMRTLGFSVWIRAKELSGVEFEIPEDWYRGEYIKDIARELLAKEPGLLSLSEDKAQDICYEYAKDLIMEGIKSDLKDFEVHHDKWFSEKSLVASGAVDRAFNLLKENGHTYEEGGALWFRTTTFGDDKDRVLRKSDGSLTYFASDIAYHSNKFDRDFEFLVDIWGADHHGYIPRMRAAIEALGKPKNSFDVVLVQLVNLMQNGQQIAMSTRAGQFETLIDVIRDVGKDAARFMFLSRKSDSPLDFDLDLVKQRTMDNPVYYVQYAHARICAILRRAESMGIDLDLAAKTEDFILEEAEVALLRKLDEFDDMLLSSAINLSPHHVSYYLMDLSKELHSYYSSAQVVNVDNLEVTYTRIQVLRAVAQVIKNGLFLLGVSAPESM